MAKKKKDPQPDQPEEPDQTNVGEPPEDAKVRKRKKRQKEPSEGKEATDPNAAQSPPAAQDPNAEMYGDQSPEVQIAPKKKAPRVLITREIGKEVLDREKFLKLCLREMMIYLVFLLIVGLLAISQHDDSEYYLSRVMTRLFVETKFHAWSTGETLNYNEINTLEQVWEYFNHYLNYTHWDYWYHQGMNKTGPEENAIFYENKLIGRPRIRQLRVRKDSCTVPSDFQLMFAHCYAEYDSNNEDKEPFGPGEGTPWTFTSPDKLGSYSVSGEISTYGGGGFYLDFAKEVEETNKTIRTLFDDLWLERGSRALILQFTTYNVNHNLFFTLKLLLELPPTGGVIPSYIIYIEKFIPRDYWDIAVAILFIIFVIYVLVYTFSEIFEMFYFRLHYLNYFWNACDLTILVLCYFVICFAILFVLTVISDLPDLAKIEDSHACFDKINTARERVVTMLAILFFFTSIKLLKYMNFNHSMFQMQMTLSKATKDIACFSIIFFIVFITFAQLGHLLFGSQVRDFRSFVHSVFALLRTAVGDFDYHKIENVNHFLGPVYFFAYIFFIYFILVNMFLAIIIDTYSEVRTNIRDQAKELQISDIVCGWIRKLLKMCGCGKVTEMHDKPLQTGGKTPYEDIQNLLRRCGFNEQEINLFLAKFDIPKDRQISQEEMRQKLLTNFNMQPEADKVTGFEPPERDEIGEKLMARIRILEDNITDVNYKIDLIDNKIDAIQQIRARRRTLAAQEQKEKEQKEKEEKEQKEKEKEPKGKK